MPRRKWVKRVVEIQLELDVWKDLLSNRIYDTESPVLRNKLDERIIDLDDAWHQLEYAAAALRNIS